MDPAKLADARAVQVRPSEGKTMTAGGSGTTFKLYAADTGGPVSVVEHPIDPGVLVPPHVHSREGQISYVIEGEVEILVGGEVYHCAAGAYLFKPRGVRHTFWTAGAGPARVIEISTPGGVERYMEELFAMLGAGPPDPAGCSAWPPATGSPCSRPWASSSPPSTACGSWGAEGAAAARLSMPAADQR
jgi:quercetin dioxygenase-like cupin family protein